MPFDIVIYAIVALALGVWLRSLLGTRHGDEQERPPFVPDLPTANTTSPLNTGQATQVQYDQSVDISVKLPPYIQIPSNMQPVFERVTADIKRKEPAFQLHDFLRKSENAYVMIVEAFVKNEQDVLKMLLHPNLFESVKNRLENPTAGTTRHIDIQAIREIMLMDMKLVNQTAYVTLRFQSDQSQYDVDQQGNYHEGHPDQSHRVIDIWTFTRQLGDVSPIWYLSETQESPDSE